MVKLGLRLGTRLGDAYYIYQMVKARRWAINAPEGFVRQYGPFYYPYPYNGAPKYVAPNTIYTAPLTGQYVTHQYGMVVPPGSDPVGVWIPNDIDPSFHAHHATYIRPRPTTAPEEFTTYLEEFIPDANAYGKVDEVVVPGVAPVRSPSAAQAVPYWAMPSNPKPGREVGHETIRSVASQHQGEPYLRVTQYPGRAPVTSSGVAPRDSPPDRNTKERKAKVGISSVPHVVGAFTEGLDLLGSLWDAVPNEQKPYTFWNEAKGRWVRRYNPTPDWKARWLWNNFDKVNLEEAVKNIIENEIEDQALGRTNKRLNKGFKPWYERSGRPWGFTTGPAL